MPEVVSTYEDGWGNWHAQVKAAPGTSSNDIRHVAFNAIRNELELRGTDSREIDACMYLDFYEYIPQDVYDYVESWS